MARTDNTETETVVADETIETEEQAVEADKPKRERKPVQSVEELLASFDGNGSGEESQYDAERKARVQRIEQLVKSVAVEIAALTKGSTESENAAKAVISLKTAAQRASKAALAVPDEAITL